MKIKQISLVLFSLLGSNVIADTKRVTPIEFKQEFNIILEAGVQGGGDGSKPIPFYDPSSDTYAPIGDNLRVIGPPWEGVDESRNEPLEDSVHFGALYKFAIGMEVPLFDNITLSFSYGYQYDETFGVLTEPDGKGGRQFIEDSKTRRKVSRQFIDLMPFYNIGRHRVGLGVAYHLSPQFLHYRYRPFVEKTDTTAEIAGFERDDTYEFNSALGFAVQYDYLVTENTSVGIKVTRISYDLKKLTSNRYIKDTAADTVTDCVAGCKDLVDANSVGIHVTYRY